MRFPNIPLACSLLAAIGLGGTAVGSEHGQWGSASDDHLDGGSKATSAEYRAAHMVDGKDRMASAKADRWNAEDADAVHAHRASDQRAWQTWRAAGMRDNKDAVSAAKGADDRSAAADERVAVSAVGARDGDAGDRERAASMEDRKTSLQPKAGRAESDHRHGRSGDGDVSRAAPAEARTDDRSTSSSTAVLAAPAAPAAKPQQPLWNSGHDTQAASTPSAVQATLDREAAGLDLDSLSKKSENGRTIYDARFARPGSDDLRLKVAEDGSVVWRNDLKEQATAPLIQPAEQASTVAPADPAKAADAQVASGSASGSVPAVPGSAPSRATPADQPVQDPGTARANADMDQAKLSTVDDSPVSVDAPAAPAKDADGWLGFGSGKRLAIEEVPKPVQDAILREADGKPISRIERDSEQGRTVYKARIRVDDAKDLKLKLAEDGSVVSRK